MPPADNQRLVFRDKFRSLHYEAFQSWLEELLHALYPTGDFQAIRKTRGDGGLDGFVISSQLVYAIYAPARRNEDRDSETAAKIRSDFTKASSTLSGNLKAWIFVHNHPEGNLGQLGITAINDLKSQNPSINIMVLNIDGLWERLKTLSDETLNRFFGAKDEDAASGSNHPELVIPADIKKLLDDADKLDAEGKYSEALVLIEEALTSAVDGTHELAIIKATIDLAECITRTGGELERAESLLRPCLEKLPPGRNDKNRESVLIYLGHIATTQGRVHEGKSLAVEALENARSRNDRFTMGRALIEVGHAEEMLGNLPAALRVLGEAGEQFRAERRSGDVKNRAGAATNLAGCLMTRAMVLEHQGNAPEMLTCLTEAEQILREGDNPDNLGRTLLTKTRMHFALSQFEQGVEALREASEIFWRIGNYRWFLKCMDYRIRLMFQFGRVQEAVQFGFHAVTLAKEHGTPHDAAERLCQLATLCKEHDLNKDAAEFLGEAKSIATKHQLHDLLADCLLDEVGEGRVKTEEQRLA